MPGIEKRPSRHPPLYGRVGFARRDRAPSGGELSFVLVRPRRRFGLDLDEAGFTDADAAAAARITGGAFRPIRLLARIDRVMRVDEPRAVAAEVVEPARSTLVIGAA